MNGTPASTPSGGRSRPGTEARSGGGAWEAAKESSEKAAFVALCPVAR